MPDLAELEIRIRSLEAQTAKKRLDDLDKTGRRAEKGAKDLENRWTRTSKTAQRLSHTVGVLKSQVALLAGAFVGLAGARAALRTLIEYERALVGVGKTTDITGEPLERLGNRFRVLSREVPVATTELLGLAQTAGQLGVTGAENLEKFAITVARLNAATADFRGEQAASQLATILNITRESLGTVDRLASVIVRLGNETNTTEGQLANMLVRVARAGVRFNVSSSEAAALSATLVSLGVRAEEAGGVAIRTFVNLEKAFRQNSDTAQLFAEEIGTSVEEFSEKLKTQGIDALVDFLAALGRLEKRGENVTAILKSIGAAGVRDLGVLLPLAQNVDRLGENLERVRDEFERNTAAINEARRAQDTLGARLSILGNVVRDVVLEFREGTGTLSRFVDFVTEVVKELAGFERAESSVDRFGRAVLIAADAVRVLTVAVGALVAIKLGGVFLALGTGIGAVVAALGVAAVAVRKFTSATFELRGETVTGGALILATWQEVTDRLSRRFRALFVIAKTIFGAVRDSIVSAFELLPEPIRQGINFIGNLFVEGTDSWLGVLKRFVNAGIAIFKSFFDIIRSNIRILVDQAGAVLEIASQLASPSTINPARLKKAFDDLRAGFAREGFGLGKDLAENFERDFVGEFAEFGVNSAKKFVETFRAELEAQGLGVDPRLQRALGGVGAGVAGFTGGGPAAGAAIGSGLVSTAPTEVDELLRNFSRGLEGFVEDVTGRAAEITRESTEQQRKDLRDFALEQERVRREGLAIDRKLQLALSDVATGLSVAAGGFPVSPEVALSPEAAREIAAAVRASGPQTPEDVSGGELGGGGTLGVSGRREEIPGESLGESSGRSFARDFASGTSRALAQEDFDDAGRVIAQGYVEASRRAFVEEPVRQVVESIVGGFAKSLINSFAKAFSSQQGPNADLQSAGFSIAGAVGGIGGAGFASLGGAQFGGVIDRESFLPVNRFSAVQVAERNKPEGILPLTRTPSGRLGVESVESQSSRNRERDERVTVPITINANTPAEFRRSERQVAASASRAIRSARRRP